MNPITGHGVHSLEDLKNYILRTCNQHKSQGRALAFAFIAFDFKDAHISKVIKDNDYWKALNDVSGDQLTIFYLNHTPDDGDPGHISYMGGIDLSSTFKPSGVSIGNLLELDNSPETPFMIFFQTDTEKISDSFLVSLKSKKIEDAFNEIINHIKNARDSLALVLPENRKNSDQIYYLIRQNVLKDGVFVRLIKDNYKWALPLLLKIVGKIIKPG